MRLWRGGSGSEGQSIHRVHHKLRVLSNNGAGKGLAHWVSPPAVQGQCWVLVLILVLVLVFIGTGAGDAGGGMPTW